MVDTLHPWIDSGRLFLVCVDSIDDETWSNESGNPRSRIELHEKWFSYVTEELLPRVRDLGHASGKAIVTGCSMGGIHAGNFFFRRPDLFDTMISLSGLFHADYFFHDYMDDLVYNNSPLHFLRNMPEDHPYMALYHSSKIILCVGQGAWEDDLLDGTRRMDALLREKNIPAWVDYWGFDVCHDWCWWQKQLPYFFENIMPL
jgi:esterase/lipase superfamily enzyme